MIPATLDRPGIWPILGERINMLDITCSRCGVNFPYEAPVDKPGARRRTCDHCKRTIRREQSSRWNAANPDKRRAIRRSSADRNVDSMRASRAAWKQRNPENVRVHRRKAKKKYPLANRAYNAAAKARRLGAVVLPFTPAQLFARMEYFGHRCWMCGAAATSIDHVKPIAKHGAHALCNMRPACVRCNTKKRDRWPLTKAELKVAA